LKVIILAQGLKIKLYPITKTISKQLLPLYDRPTIHYPFSVLMLAGIKDILSIFTPRNIDSFKTLLSSGKQLDIYISYT